MNKQIKAIFDKSGIDNSLIDILLGAYIELKEHFYLKRYRPSELEAGRFTEAAIRILQQVTTGSYIPINKPLQDIKLIVAYLENLPSTQYHDSLRIHIPRALMAVYSVRNRRNIGHIGGDIDPNIGDANYVMTVCDWVLSEFIRLYYEGELGEIQSLVSGLFVKKLATIQDFNGHLKVLNTQLSLRQQIALLVYYSSKDGIYKEKLFQSLKNNKRKSVFAAISYLENTKAFIHSDCNCLYITETGINYVETTMVF